MEKAERLAIVRRWQQAGVEFEDPESAYLDAEASIGAGSRIGPNVHLRGRTRIGRDCRIDGSAYLTNAEIGDRVHVRFSVVVADSTIGDEAVIGPFAHIRPESRLGARVHVGNFVETKKATLGDGAKANHLAYLGDASIGRDSNIGAGTITCNYDGWTKQRTTIGERVQVGSDSTLVAPVTLGDDVYVATATTVRSDVPAGALVYNQRDERVREGWTAEKRRKMAGVKKKDGGSR
jgi:bifunctional UDP-N-acetylglucosamine pyrophosphorylase / glucosamine-1-phosphate N-acetyltransferase